MHVHVLQVNVVHYVLYSFWSREKKLGEIFLPLQDFDFTFDTLFRCKFHHHNNKIDGAKDPAFELITDDQSTVTARDG